MSHSQIMIVTLFLVGIIGIFYLIFPSTIIAQQEEKTFLSSAGKIVKTTGEVIDPTGYVGIPRDLDPSQFLRDFNYGRVSQLEDGTTVREFTIIAEDDGLMEVSPGVFFNAWSFNGTVPGPTIRVTEGDLVKVKFINNGQKSHTIHFHGIHKGEMDGVFEIVGSGGEFTYEFIAEPAGLYLYHCHVMPVEEHIARGLYGAYIVDPKDGRQTADEMVMVLNGFDTDFDTENNFYAANTIPFFYKNNPIQVNTNELIRAYVINILEFDQINNFHLHGALFDHFPAGTSKISSGLTDMLTMSQGEREIIEFSFKYPGKYLFHAHKVEFSEKGWVGIFEVKDNNDKKSIEGIEYGT